MTWASLPPDLRELAEQVCTPKQLDALKLWNGAMNYRFIGHTLGISASTARGRVERGLDAVIRAAAAAGMRDPGASGL